MIVKLVLKRESREDKLGLIHSHARNGKMRSRRHIVTPSKEKGEGREGEGGGRVEGKGVSTLPQPYSAFSLATCFFSFLPDAEPVHKEYLNITHHEKYTKKNAELSTKVIGQCTENN